mmetsp:Transcript_8081/g.33212  ORF Transcript_8081/g.33212 Transcript_8081/m.33212 type:complete len:260 (-) Transcript_8081:405-1184(-)
MPLNRHTIFPANSSDSKLIHVSVFTGQHVSTGDGTFDGTFDGTLFVSQTVSDSNTVAAPFATLSSSSRTRSSSSSSLSVLTLVVRSGPQRVAQPPSALCLSALGLNRTKTGLCGHVDGCGNTLRLSFPKSSFPPDDAARASRRRRSSSKRSSSSRAMRPCHRSIARAATRSGTMTCLLTCRYSTARLRLSARRFRSLSRSASLHLACESADASRAGGEPTGLVATPSFPGLEPATSFGFPSSSLAGPSSSDSSPDASST